MDNAIGKERRRHRPFEPLSCSPLPCSHMRAVGGKATVAHLALFIMSLASRMDMESNLYCSRAQAVRRRLSRQGSKSNPVKQCCAHLVRRNLKYLSGSVAVSRNASLMRSIFHERSRAYIWVDEFASATALENMSAAHWVKCKATWNTQRSRSRCKRIIT